QPGDEERGRTAERRRDPADDEQRGVLRPVGGEELAIAAKGGEPVRTEVRDEDALVVGRAARLAQRAGERDRATGEPDGQAGQVDAPGVRVGERRGGGGGGGRGARPAGAPRRR